MYNYITIYFYPFQSWYHLSTKSQSLSTHFFNPYVKCSIVAKLNYSLKCQSSSHMLHFISSLSTKQHPWNGPCRGPKQWKLEGAELGLYGKRGRTNSRCRLLCIFVMVVSSGIGRESCQWNSWRQVP